MMLVDLIDVPAPSSLPAPYGLLLFFKVFGFTLHMIFMNLVYVGWPVALVLARHRNPVYRDAGRRLIRRMPVIIALAVNTGIVPLLFLQAAYGRWFYTATILMAWPWFAMIPMLVGAYAGVYYSVRVMESDGVKGSRWTSMVGWASALGFLFIGHLFSHGLSLMTRVNAWESIARGQDVAGSVMGLGWNFGDPTLIPRWLLMIALALMTTGVYFAVDAGLFQPALESPAVSRLLRFSWGLYTLGMVAFAVTGSVYIFYTLDPAIRGVLFEAPWSFLTVATAVVPGIPWSMLTLARSRFRGWLPGLVGAGQVLVLTLNAVSRQLVQHLELLRFVRLPSAVQPWTGPFMIFLVLFVAGTGLIGWMIHRVYRDVMDARRKIP